MKGPAMSKTKTCAYCEHFRPNDRSDGTQAGICMRFPPVPMILDRMGTVVGGGGAVGMAGVSPPVDPGFSCGEFKDAKPLALTG